jgi:hypothetical protein
MKTTPVGCLFLATLALSDASRILREDDASGSGSSEETAPSTGDKPDPDTAKIAIIGGGIGGVTTALELINAGFKNIVLYEKSPDLISSTSSMIAVSSVRAPHPSTITFKNLKEEKKKQPEQGGGDWKNVCVACVRGVCADTTRA